MGRESCHLFKVIVFLRISDVFCFFSWLREVAAAVSRDLTALQRAETLDVEGFHVWAQAEITGNKTATGNDKTLLLEYIPPQRTGVGGKKLRRYAARVWIFFFLKKKKKNLHSYTRSHTVALYKRETHTSITLCWRYWRHGRARRMKRAQENKKQTDPPDKGFSSPPVALAEWTHLHLDSAATCVVIRASDLKQCVVCVCVLEVGRVRRGWVGGWGGFIDQPMKAACDEKQATWWTYGK